MSKGSFTKFTWDYNINLECSIRQTTWKLSFSCSLIFFSDSLIITWSTFTHYYRFKCIYDRNCFNTSYYLVNAIITPTYCKMNWRPFFTFFFLFRFSFYCRNAISSWSPLENSNYQMKENMQWSLVKYQCKASSMDAW